MKTVMPYRTKLKIITFESRKQLPWPFTINAHWKIKNHAKKRGSLSFVTSTGQSSNFLMEDIEIIINNSIHIGSA